MPEVSHRSSEVTVVIVRLCEGLSKVIQLDCLCHGSPVSCCYGVRIRYVRLLNFIMVLLILCRLTVMLGFDQSNVMPAKYEYCSPRETEPDRPCGILSFTLCN